MDEKGTVHSSRLDPAVFGSLTDSSSVPHKTGLSVPSHMGHMEDGASVGSLRGALPHNVKQDNVILNQVSAFDSDVDDILCLNPLCSEGFSGKAESLASDGAAVPHRQELDSGNGHEGREGVKKNICLSVTDEEDEGYFSLSQLKDHKVATPQSGFLQLPTATSSPLHRMSEDKRPQDECRHERASKKCSISVSDARSLDFGLPLKSSASESPDGDDEMLNVGPPIFESSVCYSVTVNTNADDEERTQQTDSSYETTLPLQVQVKSVVVKPNQHSSSKNGAAASLSEHKAPLTGKHVCSDKRSRRVRFDEMDWEREKRHYVHLVKKHINEHPGAHQDVMSELHDLMAHVAENTPSTSHRQHPSDLTRRNYQQRFLPTVITLHQWQQRNLNTFERFQKY